MTPTPYEWTQMILMLFGSLFIIIVVSSAAVEWKCETDNRVSDCVYNGHTQQYEPKETQ